MLVPGLVDRLLAHRGYEGQMAPEPEAPNRPDNLFTPLPGDHGARGRFDGRARSGAGAMDPALLRAAAAALAVALPAAAAAMAWRGGRASAAAAADADAPERPRGLPRR
jgi:hypothetical protein